MKSEHKNRIGIYVRIVTMLTCLMLAWSSLQVYAADKHECFTDGCTTMVPNGTRYCDKHRCAVSWGCSSPRRGKSKYCGDHTCQKSDCYNVVVKYTKHCSSHQTDKDRETVKKYKDVEGTAFKSNTSKTCSVSGCSNKRTSGSLYCNKHTCKKSECHSLVVSKGYCNKHKSNSSSSKKKSSNYDSYYADDPEAYYEDNKDLYDSFDDAMDDWEDEYGDDY